MTKILLASSALLLLGMSVFAAPVAPSHTTAKPAKAAPLICAVTGDKIASVKDAAGKSVYKGKTYYFCCPSCKPEFDKNPAKYVKKMSSTASTPSHAM
jgi:YHS domain-containing protein